MTDMKDNVCGKTLHELVNMIPFNTQGISVFLKQRDDPNDAPGTHAADDFSVRGILKSHPELANAKVVNHSDFYGMTVLRVAL